MTAGRDSLDARTVRVVVEFARGGPGRYLSHLDTVRALQRTFARAGVELGLTHGMRPKPRLSVGLPLPVGAAAVRECAVADVVVGESGGGGAVGKENGNEAGSWQAALQAASPPGIDVLAVVRCAPHLRLRPRLALYEWTVRGDTALLAAAAARFAAEPQVLVERLGPKGLRSVDVRASVDALDVMRRSSGCGVRFGIRHGDSGAARPAEVLAEVLKRVEPAGIEGSRDLDARLTRCGVEFEGLALDEPVREWLEKHGVET